MLRFIRVLCKMEYSSSIKLSDPRWRVVSDPSLTMNDVTMTSLFPRLEGKNDRISILPINSTIWRQISCPFCVNHVMSRCWKNEYIILCNFSGRSMSGCEVIERGSRSLPTVTGIKNSLFWKGVMLTAVSSADNK